MVLPSFSSSGRTRSSTSLFPPAMIARVAFCAPTAPPETGASIISMPRAASCAAMRRAVPGGMVPMSTSTVPGFAPWTMPPSSSATASTSAPVVTMVNTTSLFAATSAGAASRRAPASTSGCAASARRA